MAARFAEELPAKLRSDFAGTMNTLRDIDFLNLLTSYPRAQRSFIVAAGVTDTVESEWLIKAGVGKEWFGSTMSATRSRGSRCRTSRRTRA